MTSVHTKQCAGFQTAVVFYRKKGVWGLSVRCFLRLSQFSIFNVFEESRAHFMIFLGCERDLEFVIAESSRLQFLDRNLKLAVTSRLKPKQTLRSACYLFLCQLCNHVPLQEPVRIPICPFAYQIPKFQSLATSPPKSLMICRLRRAKFHRSLLVTELSVQEPTPPTATAQPAVPTQQAAHLWLRIETV